ncbi:hypothetical protein JR316_0007489 [Psilocybe cubensis]|uniref:Uncharacterized protein n=2 Tax=Psilocybe cubensis TaxID=181762 RepID=A0ACB8GZN2_PSICU|nr:hypothetical protein JR316_0007489 [Psilocybe cubensis]KAH9480887.1 hypothetical protein JR316_0007489 [Psilocybe cubensis]
MYISKTIDRQGNGLNILVPFHRPPTRFWKNKIPVMASQSSLLSSDTSVVSHQGNIMNILRFHDGNMHTEATYDPHGKRKTSPPLEAENYRVPFVGFRVPVTSESYPNRHSVRPKDRPPPKKMRRIARGVGKNHGTEKRNSGNRRRLLYDDDDLEVKNAALQIVPKCPNSTQEAGVDQPSVSEIKFEPNTCQMPLSSDKVGVVIKANQAPRSESKDVCAFKVPRPPNYQPRPQFSTTLPHQHSARLHNIHYKMDRPDYIFLPPLQPPYYTPPRYPMHPQIPPPLRFAYYQARSNSFKKLPILPPPQLQNNPHPRYFYPPQNPPSNQSQFSVYPLSQQPLQIQPAPTTASQVPSELTSTYPRSTIQGSVHSPHEAQFSVVSASQLALLPVSAPPPHPAPYGPDLIHRLGSSRTEEQATSKYPDLLTKLKRLIAKYNKARSCVWDPECTMKMYGYECFSIHFVDLEPENVKNGSNSEKPESNTACSKNTIRTFTQIDLPKAGIGRTIYNTDWPAQDSKLSKKPIKRDSDTKSCLDVEKHIEIVLRLREDYIGVHLFECHGIEIGDDERPIACRPCALEKAGSVYAAIKRGLSVDIPMSSLLHHLNTIHEDQENHVHCEEVAK